MTPINRWNGKYFGLIKNGRFFKDNSQYLSWVENDGKVIKKDGTFFGEIEEENYILKQRSMATPARRAVLATPATPAPPARRSNRAPKMPRSGKIDALNEFKDT